MLTLGLFLVMSVMGQSMAAWREDCPVGYVKLPEGSGSSGNCYHFSNGERGKASYEQALQRCNNQHGGGTLLDHMSPYIEAHLIEINVGEWGPRRRVYHTAGPDGDCLGLGPYQGPTGLQYLRNVRTPCSSRFQYICTAP